MTDESKRESIKIIEIGGFGRKFGNSEFYEPCDNKVPGDAIV
jgi:hypothetical protein